ncbi:peptidase inhibitor family I36 protein [Streptomyces sp. E11-3]|uniref:peptidase inhibitor family I36 protein n=1 Tax=Streptomyces sp. E11-3 TaxID=3110112 RepID=UPI0039811BD1
MTMRTAHKRVGIAVATLALTAGGLGGVASATTATGSGGGVSAQAAKDCPKGWFCVWPKMNYKGKMQKVQFDNKNLLQYGGAFKNGVGSVYNNGKKCDVKVYKKKNYKGFITTLKRGEKRAGDGVYRVVGSNKWVNCR